MLDFSLISLLAIGDALLSRRRVPNGFMKFNIDDLSDYFLTDNETGEVFRRQHRLGNYRNPNGYVTIYYKGTLLLAHRLIWMFANGPIPPGMEIDHIDRDRKNNRLANLRLVTRSQNNDNRTIIDRSDRNGVYWNKKSNNWTARIGFQGRRVHLGQFKHLQDAQAARRKAMTALGRTPYVLPLDTESSTAQGGAHGTVH